MSASNGNVGFTTTTTLESGHSCHRPPHKVGGGGARGDKILTRKVLLFFTLVGENNRHNKDMRKPEETWGRWRKRRQGKTSGREGEVYLNCVTVRKELGVKCLSPQLWACAGHACAPKLKGMCAKRYWNRLWEMSVGVLHRHIPMYGTAQRPQQRSKRCFIHFGVGGGKERC